MTEVRLTDAARDLVARIRADAAPPEVVLVQNSGCVCGDAPQCLDAALFRPGQGDYALPTGVEGLVLLRSRKLDAGEAPEAIVIDAAEGRRGGFALENRQDRMFVVQDTAGSAGGVKDP